MSYSDLNLEESNHSDSSNFYKVYKEENTATPNTLNELAHSIYNQLETLIALYGKSAGRDFMPIIVNLLEKMEENERLLNETRKASAEYYEESVTLKKLLQTEKALRLQAEQNLFYMEEELEEERENMMRHISCADLYSIKLEKKLIKVHSNAKKHSKNNNSVSTVDRVYADISELKTRIFGTHPVNVNALRNKRVVKRSYEDVDELESKGGSHNSDYMLPVKKLSYISGSDTKSGKFSRRNSTIFPSAKMSNIKDLQRLAVDPSPRRAFEKSNSEYSNEDSCARQTASNRPNTLLEYDAGSMSVDTSHYSLVKKSQNDGDRSDRNEKKRQNPFIDMSQISVLEEREQLYLNTTLQNDELRERVKGLAEQNGMLKDQILTMEEKIEQSENVLKQFDKYCDMYCSQIESLSERVKKYESTQEIASQVSNGNGKAVFKLERKVEKYKAQIIKYRRELSQLTDAVNWYLQFNLVENAERLSTSFSTHYVNNLNSQLNLNRQNSSPINSILNKVTSMDSSEPASGVKKVANFFRKLFKPQNDTYVSGSSSPTNLNAFFGANSFGRDLVDVIDTCFCSKTYENAFSRFFTLGKLYERSKEAVSSVLVVCKEKLNIDGNSLTTIQFVNVDNTISVEFDAEAENDPVTTLCLVDEQKKENVESTFDSELSREKIKAEFFVYDEEATKSLWVAFKSGLLLVYNVENLLQVSNFHNASDYNLLARIELKAPASCIANYKNKVVVSTVDGRLLLFVKKHNEFNFNSAYIYDLKELKNAVRSIVLSRDEFWMAGRESKILVFSAENFTLKNEFEASPNKPRMIKMLTSFTGRDERFKYIAGIFKMSTTVAIYDVDNYTHLTSIECLPWLMTRFPKNFLKTSSSLSFVQCWMVNYNVFLSTNTGIVFCVQLDKELVKTDEYHNSFIDKTGAINTEKFMEAYKNYRVLRYRHDEVFVLCAFYYSDSKIVLGTCGCGSADQFGSTMNNNNNYSNSRVFEGGKHETESKNTTVNLYMV